METIRTSSSDNSPLASFVRGPSLRVAAVGDLHLNGSLRRFRWAAETLKSASATADAIVLCGDLTHRGRIGELWPLVDILPAVPVPVVAVLGNNDLLEGAEEEIVSLLEQAGVDILDGTAVSLGPLGFAGTKGAGGGFAADHRATIGESSVNRLIESAEEEARKLTMALEMLRTDVKVAVLHYAPIEATVIGEPAARRLFLGSSLLGQAIDAGRATVVFHGHAHRGGADRAATPGGIPVFNVARPVLRRAESRVHIWEYRLPGFPNY